jgi:formamidopyrimidine-DNA glycosylase
MPELPEVENLRRGLQKNIVGQKILKVKVTKPKLVSGKGAVRTASSKKVSEFEHGLKGETFSNIERRAKNLIFKFKSGKIILAHLKMSGQFVYKPKAGKQIIGGHPIELSEKTLPNKHSHIIFELNKGTLYYNDTRMFGYLLYYPTLGKFEAENHFELLGLEPLDKKFTPKYLEENLKNKSGNIKSVLMNQTVVTGLGNIYVDESLFEAKIKPTRSASSLTHAEIKLLHTAIIRILKRAIQVGGSSVATYRLLDQSQGNYAREHKVYGKAGKPCPRCGHPLKKILIQSRTTIFCPNCQN